MRDQIAHTIMTFSWSDDNDFMQELGDPTQAYLLADQILNHTESVRWCSVHQRSVTDSRATACLSGGKVRCEIEVRYLLRSGPPPPFDFSDEDIETVRKEIQAESGVLMSYSTVQKSLQRLRR